MKNPDRVLTSPAGSVDLGLNPAIAQNYAILLCLPRRWDNTSIQPENLSRDPRSRSSNPSPDQIRARINSICNNIERSPSEAADRTADLRLFLAAGFDLADEYCDAFFEDADESQRRRQFGRAATNDAGTAISTILGLANAGENLVTGVAAGFGLADGLWRNYDEAFVVGPDLANVQALVNARQRAFRHDLHTGKAQFPDNFIEAQSEIRRYAGFCSYLGMTALLNSAARAEQEELERGLEPQAESEDTSDASEENQR